MRTVVSNPGFSAELTGNSSGSNYRFARMTDSLRKKAEAANADIKTTTMNDIIANKQAGQYTLSTGTTFDEIGNMAYWDKKSDSIFVREKMMSEYVITKEKTPAIKWNITEETQKIHNYNCLKATTQFRGRNYTAWFTPDIPISDGPWKFKGLPGLLMSLQDEDYQVKIYAEQVEFPSKERLAGFVQKGKPILLDEYFQYINNERNLFFKRLEATVATQPEYQNASQAPPKAKIKRSAYYKIEKRY